MSLHTLIRGCNPSAHVSCIPLAIALAGTLLLAAPAAADNVSVDWTRGCPPNGYGVAAQPPFDLDLDGDGTKDAWDIPLTLPKAAGGSFTSSDAQGNKVFLPAIPHSLANPGGPSGHYSPRFVKAGGPTAGTEVGQCVYPCGRNTWTVCFKDQNNDCIPDKFTKSTWVSEDYVFDPTLPGTGWNKYNNKSTTFTTDLTKDKIVPARVVAGGGLLATVWSIVDATIVDLGADLSGVMLEGAPVGLPDGAAPMIQGPSVTPTCQHALTGDDAAVAPGDSITVQGLITNLGMTSHVYNVALFGVNVSGLLPPPPMVIPPGASAAYSVSGIVTSSGPAAVAAYAHADTGLPTDNCMDAAVFLPSECFLVIGAGPGHEVFAPGSHEFLTQIGDIAASAPVLMTDVFELVLPKQDLGALIDASATAGGTAPLTSSVGYPEWVGPNGEFAVQVLLWNPVDVPSQPEQWSYGVRVRLLPDGSVLARPFGSGTGITLWIELTKNAAGQDVLKFPFQVPGF